MLDILLDFFWGAITAAEHAYGMGEAVYDTAPVSVREFFHFGIAMLIFCWGYEAVHRIVKGTAPCRY